jgi:hypothetical protein
MANGAFHSGAEPVCGARRSVYVELWARRSRIDVTNQNYNGISTVGPNGKSVLVFAALLGASCGIDVTGSGQALPSDGGGADGGVLADGTGPSSDQGAPGDGGRDVAANTDSGCGDLATDPHNCGACGHDCLGGACVGGACSPVFLAKITNPRHLVIANTSLYVTSHTSNGGVYEVPTAGVPDGGSARALISGLSNPNHITLTGTDVYFGLDTSSGSVRRCGIGPTGTCDILVGSQDTPTGIISDGTNVFWSEWGSGNVNRCPNGACGGTALRVVSGLNGPTGVAKENNTVVFADEGTAPSFTNGRILTAIADQSTSSPVELARNQLAPVFVVVQQGIVYWGGLASAPLANDVQIKSCPISGCSSGPKTIADKQASLGDLLIDGNDLYWSRYGGGADDGVYTCPITGCPPSGPTRIALDGSPRGVAVDRTMIYWASYQDNAVHRIAR